MAEFEEMTVEDLIRMLSGFDPKAPVVVVYDGGAFRETMRVYARTDRANVFIEIPS